MACSASACICPACHQPFAKRRDLQRHLIETKSNNSTHTRGVFFDVIYRNYECKLRATRTPKINCFDNIVKISNVTF